MKAVERAAEYLYHRTFGMREEFPLSEEASEHHKDLCRTWVREVEKILNEHRSATGD